MAPIDEPTFGEVLRRLDHVVAQLDSIAKELKQDRVENARIYVRQDVYFAERRTLEANLSDVRTDVATAETKLGREIREIKDQQRDEKTARRQVWLAVGTCAVASLIALAGLIVTIVRG